MMSYNAVVQDARALARRAPSDFAGVQMPEGGGGRVPTCFSPCSVSEMKAVVSAGVGF